MTTSNSSLAGLTQDQVQKLPSFIESPKPGCEKLSDIDV